MRRVDGFLFKPECRPASHFLGYGTSHELVIFAYEIQNAPGCCAHAIFRQNLPKLLQLLSKLGDLTAVEKVLLKGNRVFQGKQGVFESHGFNFFC